MGDRVAAGEEARRPGPGVHQPVAAPLLNVVLRLAVDLVAPDRGGRSRPVRDGYRASLSFGRWRRHEERIVHDAVLVWEGDADAVAPGAQAIARAWVLLPEEMPRFDPGRVLTLAEGERLIARAEVLDVLVDDAESPLADLRAAKSRPLAER